MAAGGEGVQTFHQPVLLAEILALFERIRKERALVMDCTLGAGGHAQAILSMYSSVTYIGIDADPEARKRAAERLSPYSSRLEVLGGYFDEVLSDYAVDLARAKPDFIFFDLGLSIHQLQGSRRGFSFAVDEALDMRFSPDTEVSAYDLVNTMREEELANLIYKYGEEKLSRRIARAICEARQRAPIRTSAALASIVSGAVPSAYRHSRIHPATRTFQALRISVNDELGREERALAKAVELLAPGGILAVISFHSLEDRVAKLLCREYGRNRGFEDIYNPPLVPGDEECSRNPASRSAKLRALRAPTQGIGDPSTGGMP
ncbi:MAG: 16S rRNA (cytosine(1402)-N(4))-methyltransferase RsmH [Spirochaetes bacterium]|nr:16S rRNA (cytosine(1402)-N(4))-methyltransferase RsmH [Spirochaetota bacterium]